MNHTLLCWLFLLALPALQEPEPRPFYIRGFAQGTSYQVTYYAESNRIEKTQVDSIFAELDSSLSIYRPYSLINQFNNSASGLQADEHLRAVVEKALAVATETGGTFDATVRPLTEVWGFGTGRVSQLPDSATIRRILRHVGPDKVRLEGNHVSKKAPAVQLDVNGIAQGYSVDVLARFLESKGIRSYLVEVGGEIRVKGRKQPGDVPMSIGIEAPAAEGQFTLQKVIKLERGAITSSGNYRKYHENDGKRISHLLDPRAGFPVQNNLISITVWAKDAITADAYDNALMVMGLEKALEFVTQQQELEAFFIYRKETGVVADTASAGFYRLLQ